MFETRWTELASYHLTVQSEQAALNEQEALRKLAIRRVSEAIQDNESGIATKLGFKVASGGGESISREDQANLFNRSHLALSDISSIEEDWRVSAQGIAQSMTVYRMALVDKNRENLKVADVDVVVKSRPPPSSRSTSPPSRMKDVRIELTSAVGISKQHFVLDGPEGDGEGRVIDVKKRR